MADKDFTCINGHQFNTPLTITDEHTGSEADLCPACKSDNYSPTPKTPTMITLATLPSATAQEETIEGNRLIAEFMGYQCEGGDQYSFYGLDKPRGYATHLNIKAAKYNTWWSWLMPVVEKIEGEHFDVFIGTDYATIYEDDKGDKIDRARYRRPFRSPKILMVWQVVVLFIKWHKNKKTA